MDLAELSGFVLREAEKYELRIIGSGQHDRMAMFCLGSEALGDFVSSLSFAEEEMKSLAHDELCMRIRGRVADAVQDMCMCIGGIKYEAPVLDDDGKKCGVESLISPYDPRFNRRAKSWSRNMYARTRAVFT